MGFTRLFLLFYHLAYYKNCLILFFLLCFVSPVLYNIILFFPSYLFDSNISNSIIQEKNYIIIKKKKEKNCQNESILLIMQISLWFETPHSSNMTFLCEYLRLRYEEPTEKKRPCSLMLMWYAESKGLLIAKYKTQAGNWIL